jgi:hypothetical protein
LSGKDERLSSICAWRSESLFHVGRLMEAEQEQRRTNVWRKATSLPRGAKRLRSNSPTNAFERVSRPMTTHADSPPTMFAVFADESRRDHYPPALELVAAYRFALQARNSLDHPTRRPRPLIFQLGRVLKPMRPPPRPHRRHCVTPTPSHVEGMQSGR